METGVADGARAVQAPRSDRFIQAVLSSPFLGTAIAVLSWPIYSIAPGLGPDASWAAGLYMAHGAGLGFGTGFVFTYGPLGFLEVPALYDQHLWLLSFAYRSFLHLALAISLVWVARRALPLAIALCACYALLVIGYIEAEAVLLAFVWCAVVLGSRAPGFALPMVTYGGAALGALELLGKTNFGIAIFAFCALALLGLPDRRRNLLRFAATAVAALCGLWLVSGQSPDTIWDFARNSWQVISGYSQAMGADLGDVGWEVPFAVGAIALLIAGAALATRRAPLARRIALPALAALFGYLNFKQGFVRQGYGNDAEFFALMTGAGIAIASLLPDWRRAPARLSAFAMVVPLAALALATVPAPTIWDALKPADHVTYLRKDLDAFFGPDTRDRIQDEARATMRSAYRLDPTSRGLLGEHPVHIDPWEISAAWAYGLRWRPLPVIEGYTAYTPALDRLQVAALNDADGPSRILRLRPDALAGIVDSSIDDRLSAWDPPAAAIAMLCNFRAARTTHRWQVLVRVPNRCGKARWLTTVRTTTGVGIAVPPPPGGEGIVIAKIDGLGVHGWESVKTMLYRADRRSITVDGRRTWRLVPATAGDGLIMRAPRPVDFPHPFQLAPDTRRFSVQVEGQKERPITVRFFTLRVLGQGQI